MYLHGSLVLGDFDPQRSDIDFLVVTVGEIPNQMFSALAGMHARLATSDSLAKELEGSYIPPRARHPHHERHGRLRVEHHESDWVIHRHVLRRHGVTVAGPAPRTLIDPIGPGELRRAVLECLLGWWAPMLQDPTHD